MRDDLDPLEWAPVSGREIDGRPEPGNLIGYKYALWRVSEVNPVADVDLNDDQRRQMALRKREYRELCRPYRLVLVHVVGPVLSRVLNLTDGTKTLHVGVDRPGGIHQLRVVPDRYQVCSCHGHPWPCQDVVMDRHLVKQATQLDRLLLTATPGLCAACTQPISSRQKTLTFPEPSLVIPGAPGPTYHAGRGDCWYEARQYELKHRLPAMPGVARVASCPGYAFVHSVGGAIDCDAGALCTGLHGPRGSGGGNGACYTKYLDRHAGTYPTPLTNCGYRHPQSGGRIACLGPNPSV